MAKEAQTRKKAVEQLKKKISKVALCEDWKEKMLAQFVLNKMIFLE